VEVLKDRVTGLQGA